MTEGNIWIWTRGGNLIGVPFLVSPTETNEPTFIRDLGPRSRDFFLYPKQVFSRNARSRLFDL